MNTSQYSELDRVKLKIKALTEKTVAQGATEAEAMSAMELVGKLLKQYNLKMSELDVRTSNFKTINLFVGNGRASRHPTFDALSTSLARLIDGKTWFHKEYIKNEKGKFVLSERGRYQLRGGYAFFGQEHELELVEYYFNLIKTVVTTESAIFKTTDDYKLRTKALGGVTGAKTALVSFQRGLGTRLSERLSDIKKQNDKVYEEALKATGETVEVDGEVIKKPTGTNLIVLKGQLTEEEFKKTNIKLRSSYRYHRRSDYNAYAKGYAAGDKVNLNRPIGGGTKVSGSLT